MGSTPSLQATFDRWSGPPWPSKRKQASRLPSASPRLSIGFRSRTGVADQPAGQPMLNGYEAFAVGGAFELFDAHGVSFVSVAQQFNTTTSMGRPTLNVLLSFAQFE
jgi:hypothetical protein